MTFTILLLGEFCVVFMSKHSSCRMSIKTQWHFDAGVLAWAPSRTLIYTTNAIEGLNRAIRKVIKTRTLFPNEDAAKKLIYLAIMNFTASWKRATPKWAAAMPQFALLFGERFTGAME